MRIKRAFWGKISVMLMSGALVISGLLPAALPAAAATDEATVKTYTFKEVGEIAQRNSSEIIRQKSTVEQAEQNKESQLSAYQNQVYNFYGDPDSTISESSLLSLQDNYESALNSYTDAEETLTKLKPKVAYQAQKLYLDILQSGLQIQAQEKEIERLKDEYELAKVKTAFGAFTQAQLSNAKSQWENALEALDNLKDARKANMDGMREYLNLAATVEFTLENPPEFGAYETKFDEEEVMAAALKNSLALKQAQREVDELGERIRRYQGEGESGQAERLASSGPGKELALKETRQSLIKSVENTMKEYNGLDNALSKATESLYAAQRTQLTTRMRLGMGLSTLNEVRNAEKAVLAAEKEATQARYNCYLGAKKVELLKEGILVN